MKKATKRMLVAIVIILIFGLSSVAFVVGGITGGHLGGGQQDELQPLTEFVVNGEIDPRLESAYIQGGFTVLKLFYTQAIPAYTQQLPSMFVTNDNQIQLIVENIPSDREYATILNANGVVDLNNTSEESVYDALCSNVLFPPAECVLISGNDTLSGLTTPPQG